MADNDDLHPQLRDLPADEAAQLAAGAQPVVDELLSTVDPAAALARSQSDDRGEPDEDAPLDPES